MTEIRDAQHPRAPLRPSLLRHGAALIYDTLLVLPMVMLVVALAMGAAVIGAGGEPEPLRPVLVQVLAALTVATFYCVFWRKSGQTLGMQAWRIHLLTESGTKPALRACIIRLLVAPVSLACLGAGFWWSLFDPSQRYWHDIASQTRLELRPKSQ